MRFVGDNQKPTGFHENMSEWIRDEWLCTRAISMLHFEEATQAQEQKAGHKHPNAIELARIS